jgi:formamidopyrimidine-DNA glycosylase
VPELPEVETVRRSLEPFLKGVTILAVEVREPRLRRPLDRNFAGALTGRTVEGIGRRGKYLQVRLDDGRLWLVHLGMTGQLVAEQVETEVRPHDHILMTLSTGHRLRYNDPRRFGLMAVGTAQEIDRITDLGVEPLNSSFCLHYLWDKTQATRRTIKDVLMDQRVVAGIGNIYASELLFRAGVRPNHVAVSLDRSAVRRIITATKAVLREAIRHRGSSISDYRDGEGKEGGFQTRFRVYDREGKPCGRCRSVIIREIRGGRSAFFCPTCQR